MDSIADYINTAEGEVKERLIKLRLIINEEVPNATEKIAYKMPAFYTEGKPLVYFAYFKNHIGFYGAGSALCGFDEKLKPYKRSKGTIQFPHNKELPYDLVREIIKFRVRENIEKVQSKR